eukprot:bmy_07945T0
MLCGLHPEDQPFLQESSVFLSQTSLLGLHFPDQTRYKPYYQYWHKQNINLPVLRFSDIKSQTCRHGMVIHNPASYRELCFKGRNAIEYKIAVNFSITFRITYT